MSDRDSPSIPYWNWGAFGLCYYLIFHLLWRAATGMTAYTSQVMGYASPEAIAIGKQSSVGCAIACNPLH
ncbi:hypothetical protein [Nostoc sp. PCC 7524]|uniref:hypothetical protein n=1 Tax=Nostoc sp. (strain ATCC 29411 / PCC 7524) TaxID=28072 RepID=UPI0011818644|nr:hypothetical protein [Nostoc sp. PCC 7524]